MPRIGTSSLPAGPIGIAVCSSRESSTCGLSGSCARSARIGPVRSRRLAMCSVAPTLHGSGGGSSHRPAPRNDPCSGVRRRCSMPDLKEKQRKSMNKDVFAYVDENGEGHLPLNDESHVRNAIARFNQTSFPSASAKESARRKVRAAAKKHGIELSEDDNVA